jgi:thioredoxin-like negative regulator of GroEL
MVHGLEADYWGQVDFVYIDREAAANQDVVQRFGISSQPIFIFLSPDGTEIDRAFGYLDEAQLRASLDSLLG